MIFKKKNVLLLFKFLSVFFPHLCVCFTLKTGFMKVSESWTFTIVSKYTGSGQNICPHFSLAAAECLQSDSSHFVHLCNTEFLASFRVVLQDVFLSYFSQNKLGQPYLICQGHLLPIRRLFSFLFAAFSDYAHGHFHECHCDKRCGARWVNVPAVVAHCVCLGPSGALTPVLVHGSQPEVPTTWSPAPWGLSLVELSAFAST